MGKRVLGFEGFRGFRALGVLGFRERGRGLGGLLGFRVQGVGPKPKTRNPKP